MDEKEKEKYVLEMTSRKEEALNRVVAKVEPVTDEERTVIRELFWQKLDDLGKTQTMWCKENGVKEALVANVLAGRTNSRPTMSLIAKYVLDDSWE